MSPKTIAEKLDAMPPRPLKIYLSDGSVHDVESSRSAMIFSRELIFGVDPDENGLPTRTVYADPHHVTRIEVMAPAGNAENGHGRDR